MQSSKTRLLIGLLVMLVGVLGILIKFDKMPGVHLDGRTGRVEFGAGAGGAGGGGGEGGGDESQGGGKKGTKGDDLRLCGLSGPATRRLAIVNNQTIAVGETARVEVRGEMVKVLCQEIRTNSVIVQVVGAREPVELFLEEVSLAGPGVKAPRTAQASHKPAPTGQTERVEIDAEKLKLISTQLSTNTVPLQLNVTNGIKEILAEGQKLQPRE